MGELGCQQQCGRAEELPGVVGDDAPEAPIKHSVGTVVPCRSSGQALVWGFAWAAGCL